MKKILKKYFNYYIVVTCISIIAAILWINFVNNKTFSDFLYYHQHAITIANGGLWGDTYTSMGYPIVLALIYKIFGANIFYAKVFNIFLTLIMYVFFYALIKKLKLNEISTKIIYTIFVFWPNNITYNSLACTEILFTCILLGILIIYFSEIKNKYIYVGILTGIETMIKPFFLIFFFAIFIYELIKIDFKKSIIHCLTVLIVSAIVISPWLYRNTKLIGQFTYVSNNDGIVLYINNNSQNKWGRWMPVDDIPNSITKTNKYKNANMTEKNHMLKSAAKKWILKHPGDFIKLGYLRLKNTYYLADDILYTTFGSNVPQGIQGKLYNYNSIIKHILLIPALLFMLFYSVYIIYCLFTHRQKSLNGILTLGLIISYMFACVYFVTEGQARYSFPVMFLIIIYFFYAIKIAKAKIKGDTKCYI